MDYKFQSSNRYAFLMTISLLLVGSCSTIASESPPEEPIKITVNMLPFMSFAPFAFAESEGFFADQGLEVEFVTLFNDVEAIVGLSQGDIDVVANFVSAGMLNAIASDGNIQMVADKGYISPTGCTVNAILARKDLGEIPDASALAGAVVAMEPPTLEGYVVDQLLADVDIHLDDLETVDMPPPSELDAFESGSLDFTVTSEPWVTRTLQAGNTTLWMPLEDIVPDLQFAVVMFGPNLLRDSPEVGRRFMVAYLQAIQQYNLGKTEENMRAMADFTEEDEIFLEEVCWPTFRSDGSINVQSVLDFQDWAIENEFLENRVTKDQFWNPSYIEYANETLDSQ